MDRYLKVVEFVKELPKSGSGKIQRRRLQEKEREKAGSKDCVELFVNDEQYLVLTNKLVQ